MHDGLWLERGGAAAPDTVQEDSRTHEIPFTPPLPCDRGAVVSMQQAGTRRERRECRTKELLLLGERSIIQLGGVKMGEGSLRLRQLKKVFYLLHFTRWDSGAAHTGIDRQMPRAAYGPAP